uniref:Copine family member 9 n=1 Tax=Buteo japonicus TaxID=224669 RepID=A0A8C0AYC6_9AVES
MIRGEDRRTHCGARWVAPRVAHAWLPSPRNLLDMDTFSKSDPGGWQGWTGGTFGRTEVIDNTLNPDFVRKFVLDYYFEEKQNLRFDVYNVDSKSCSVLKQVSGARAGGTRGDAPVSRCGGAPRGRAPCGCCWGGTGASRRALTRWAAGLGVPKPGGPGAAMPARPAAHPLPAFAFRTVKIDVYDWDRDGSHDFIGEFATSYRELSRAQSQFTVYEVLNPRKKCKKKKYVNSGTVSGAVGSDPPTVPAGGVRSTSLHYASPYQLSAYALALKAVGEIIQDYDSDKLFPAYGFGAKLPPDGKISHQFPLNNNVDNPSCAGIEGVLESYLQSLRTVQLYGPTNFAPVINQVAGAAAQVTDGSQYHVLLIITDGVISDMLQTKEAIVTASALPMSIIIVGVGPAEFEAMEELDGDEVRVSSRGRYAERDIVQFVPFRDYVDDSGNQVLSMARLAKDVLAEIPEQLLSYMKTRDIKPRRADPQ